jgi:hypothetical protein
MAEPGGIRAVVRDAAEARDQIGGGLGVAAGQPRLGLVQHRLIETGAAAPRLIHHVARHPVADEVGIPPFAAVRRRFQAGPGVRGTVHHDHRPPGAGSLCRYLELHVHLPDRDLLGHRAGGRRTAGRGGRQCRGVLRDLLDAADEETALVFNHQRAAEESLRGRTLARHRRRQDAQQDDEGRKGSHEGSPRTTGDANGGNWGSASAGAGGAI